MESKKVKLSVPELEDAFGALTSFDNLKIPYIASYWIGRNMKVIKGEFDEISVLKQKLLQDYALLDNGKPVFGDVPGSIKLKPETSKEYWKHLAEINKQEVEITVWPIELSSLKDKDGNSLEIKPSVFMSLGFLFVDDEAFLTTCVEFLKKRGYEVVKK